jgi:hypothetical protein
MNRDETVELFLKGREAWNAWAKGLLAQGKAMEAAGTCKSHRPLREPEKGETPETQAWLDKAFADFSGCLFLIRGEKGIKETAGEHSKESAGSGPPVKSIQLGANSIDFGGFVFPSTASFERATFSSDASFERAAFTGLALFESATFSGDARFDSATFSGNAQFESATFIGLASFERTSFTGTARFDSATFIFHALFESTTFASHAFFGETQFTQAAIFRLASFKQYASFASTHFEVEASFHALRGEGGFDMEGAVFEAVPDFIQAHFEEAPRLDNLKVHGRWIARSPFFGHVVKIWKWQDRWWWYRYSGGLLRTWPRRAAIGAWHRVRKGNPARWRALKRLAIQGHDTERELEFHARELQSQRFEADWPLPFRFWSPASWAGALRFWYGIFYGLFSDFGRSTIRPALLWFATVAVFALYFLAGQPDVMPRWQAGASQGAAAAAVAYVKLIPSLWSEPPRCYAGADGKLKSLDQPVAESTDALAEAFRLAIRNGSIFLDGGDDSTRRSYGCLYGIQSYGGSPAPFVPGFVSDASGLQKLLSALYLFLFGLALRNMLKMK